MIFKQIRGLGITALVTLGLLGASGANPALAYIFRASFCGEFVDDSGKVNASWIEIDTEAADAGNDYGIVDAFISTTRDGITVEYEFDDFIGSGKGTSSSAPFPENYDFELGESVYWTFKDDENDGYENGFFNVVFPMLDFNEILASTEGDYISFDIFNAECRNSLGCAKEPDKVNAPEPNTIISLVGLGLMGLVGKGKRKGKKIDKK